MIVKKKIIDLTVSDGVCSIVPHTRKTIAVLEHAEGDIICHVDPSRSIVGDELVLILSRDNLGVNWSFTFAKENNFVFTSCGELENGTYSPGNKSFVMNFFFNGNYFLDTFENC